MNLTVRHLTQTVFKEFSRRKIEKFTMLELARLANLSRSTLYYYFEDLNHVYKVVFQDLVLRTITKDCHSVEQLLENVVNFIDCNKVFCLNLYYKTAMLRNYQQAINLLNELLSRFDQDFSDYNAITAYIFTIDDWFRSGLQSDKDTILNNLKAI